MTACVLPHDQPKPAEAPGLNSVDWRITSGPQVSEHLRAYADTERSGDDVAKATCSVEDCDKPSRRRGWCVAHYAQWYRKNRSHRCAIDGCGKTVSARGWCAMHYVRWQTHGDPLVERPAPISTCSVEGCDRPNPPKNRLCTMHAARRWRLGSFELPPKPTIEECFWAKVEKTEACWMWRGTVYKRGYGMFVHKYRRYLAHRFSYTLLIGEIPKGLTLDHLCVVPTCVNPEHLEPVTNSENVRRMHARRRSA